MHAPCGIGQHRRDTGNGLSGCIVRVGDDLRGRRFIAVGGSAAQAFAAMIAAVLALTAFLDGYLLLALSLGELIIGLIENVCGGAARLTSNAAGSILSGSEGIYGCGKRIRFVLRM